jgi:hypothetical protein
MRFPLWGREAKCLALATWRKWWRVGMSLFPVIALGLDSTWAAAAGTVRQWFTRSPRRLALIGGAGGLAMIGLSIGIAATGRKDLGPGFHASRGTPHCVWRGRPAR